MKGLSVSSLTWGVLIVLIFCLFFMIHSAVSMREQEREEVESPVEVYREVIPVSQEQESEPFKQEDELTPLELQAIEEGIL